MNTNINGEGMTRRDFMMGIGIGAPALYVSKMVGKFEERQAEEKVDIGECRSIKICCISETSWFDNVQLMKDIMKAGGTSANQYFIQWHPKNSGGYSALVEVEGLTGTWRRFLLDTGWNPAWMVYSFMREGIDDMLRKGDIEFLYVSHEHMDHFWSLPVILQYRPDLKVIISKGYSQEGKSFFQEGGHKGGHKGELLELCPGRVHKLFLGCASVTFDIPVLLGVQGEQNLFFNVKGKGLVIVTACCHMGILNLIKYAQEKIYGGDKVYGLYGGLHISPFEEWDRKLDGVITGLKAMKLQKVAANHCTGMIAVHKMMAANIPVVKGRAKYGSCNDLYLGNGDEIIF
jgi:7,8-dihydropterin-6-yl-methyl-4-(beta-D-ribofuranosyl)aminobenzene 5'-phosphate synthase